ncbi:hypothetical protein [Peristeroidobacter soli]|uniref:hypothetical protein n=1 Tax=Peristeroidobacter soli TaxID=2497877 RepID=UPI00158D09D7|nr:hypothetical protein [Peristeroidobacter soli]
MKKKSMYAFTHGGVRSAAAGCFYRSTGLRAVICSLLKTNVADDPNEAGAGVALTQVQQLNAIEGWGSGRYDHM